MGYIHKNDILDSDAVQAFGTTGLRFMKWVISPADGKFNTDTLSTAHGSSEAVALATSFNDSIENEQVGEVVKRLPEMIGAYRSYILACWAMGGEAKAAVKVDALLGEVNALLQLLLRPLAAEHADGLVQVDDNALKKALDPLHRLLFTLNLLKADITDLQYDDADQSRVSIYQSLKAAFRRDDYADAPRAHQQLYAVEDMPGFEAKAAADGDGEPAAAAVADADEPAATITGFQCPADVWLKQLHQVMPGYLGGEQVNDVVRGTKDWNLKTVDGMKAMVASIQALDAGAKDKGPRTWQQPAETLPYFQAALLSFGWQTKSEGALLQALYTTFHPKDRSTLDGHLGVSEHTWTAGFKKLDDGEHAVPQAEVADAFDYLLCTLNGKKPIVFKQTRHGMWARGKGFGLWGGAKDPAAASAGGVKDPDLAPF